MASNSEHDAPQEQASVADAEQPEGDAPAEQASEASHEQPDAEQPEGDAPAEQASEASREQHDPQNVQLVPVATGRKRGRRPSVLSLDERRAKRNLWMQQYRMARGGRGVNVFLHGESVAL